MSTRAIILRETLVSVVINVVISIAFFFAAFGLGASIDGARFGVDFLPQALMVALMGTLIPGLLVRRGRGTAIRPVVLRSIVIALTSLVLAGGGAWLVFSAVATIDPNAGLAIKIVFSAVLSLLVTPIAVRAALHAPVTMTSVGSGSTDR